MHPRSQNSSHNEQKGEAGRWLTRAGHKQREPTWYDRQTLIWAIKQTKTPATVKVAGVVGRIFWGRRTRTFNRLIQNQVPYHLAIPQGVKLLIVKLTKAPTGVEPV